MELFAKIASFIYAPFFALATIFTAAPIISPSPTPQPIAEYRPVSAEYEELKREIAQLRQELGESQSLGVALPQLYAFFEDSLASSMTASSTSFTLVRGTESKTATTLSGDYILTLDEGTAVEEFVLATCTGTSCTTTAGDRGLSPVDLTTHVYAQTYAHRRGATVKITDAQLIRVSRILNGDATVPNIIRYQNSGNTFTTSSQIISKGYADDLAIAGAPDGNNATKGIFEGALVTELASSAQTGDTTARLTATSGSFSETYSAGVQRVPVSQGNGLLSGDWIPTASSFTWTGAQTFNTATTTFSVTSVFNAVPRGYGFYRFGGDGSNGVQEITSGTTTIDVGGEEVYERNYQHLRITGTGALTFSNPSPNGTIVILKSQGDCTLTGASNAIISVTSIGATGGAGGSTDDGSPGGGGGGGASAIRNGSAGANASGTPVAGVAGSDYDRWLNGQTGTVAAAGDASGNGGAGGVSADYNNATNVIPFVKLYGIPGGGGGGGAGGSTGAGGAGGRGGGMLWLECAGTLNFANGTILATGANGTNGSGNGGGGGGGGGGWVAILYNLLSANTGTITTTGGAGGTSGGGAGGAGGNGYSIVLQNRSY